MIIGTVSFGGSAAAFFSASDMRMSRFSLAMTRSAVPTGVPYRSAWMRAVATALMPGSPSLAEVFVGLPPILQIGQFRCREAELFRELHGLRADLSRDLAECRFDRHAGLHADQQHVERIGKRLLDRLPALVDEVGKEQVGQIEADEAAAERRARS